VRIICTKQEDYKLARLLADVAITAEFEADVVVLEDAYALTIWSSDDVSSLKDERARSMSREERIRFMDYARRQLKDDMTERGWESMNILIGLFFDKKEADATGASVATVNRETL
jgi:hypothetical protein